MHAGGPCKLFDAHDRTGPPVAATGFWGDGMSDEILLEAAALEDGETVRIVCPTCMGGGSKERSLNISSTDGTVLWKCHRASCNERGASGDRRNFVRTRREEPRAQKFTPFKGELEYLSGEWTDYLRDTIGWVESHLDIGRPMYTPDDHRVAYPIFSPLGKG